MLRKNQYKDLSKWHKTSNKQKRKYYGKTQNAKNQYKRWTEREVKLVLEHKMTDTELSSLIGRSVAAIQIKRCQLKNR